MAKSYSSFDTNDFIDLDTALVEEELRSLGPTPEHAQRDYSTSQSPFKFSLKSIDEKETERFRRSLVTPLSRYNTPEWRSRSKSPTGSYAESVALFKNLSNNHDNLDLVSSDFNDFMNSYDDDLMSRQGGYPNQEEVYHHHPSSNTPFLQKMAQNKSKQKLPNVRYTERPPPPSKPRKSSFDASVQTSSGYILPTIIKTKKSTPALIAQRRLSKPNDLHKDMERLVISKRQSVDSDALRKLKEQQQEPKQLKRHSTLLASSRPRLVDNSTKLKSPSLQSNNIKLNVPQKSIINSTTTTQRSSTALQQQPDKRRWSSYIPEDLQRDKKQVDPSRLEQQQPTETRQSAYARRRHTLSSSSQEEQPTIPRYRHLDEKRYYADTRHYTAETTMKPRRHMPDVVYYDDSNNEEEKEPPRRHRTFSNPQERYRKLSNNREVEIKEVRFHPEEIVASHSSGLLSSSTTSSSHSSDLYYDPPSPVAQKKRSMPLMDMVDEQVRVTENRYSQYLSRRKAEEEPRRQRVVSEDNENYKFTRRKSLKQQQQPLSPSQIPVNTARSSGHKLYRPSTSSTEEVTESARKVLALVQQRRNKSMLLPSNYPKRRDIYYH